MLLDRCKLDGFQLCGTTPRSLVDEKHGNAHEGAHRDTNEMGRRRCRKSDNHEQERESPTHILVLSLYRLKVK